MSVIIPALRKLEDVNIRGHHVLNDSLEVVSKEAGSPGG